MLRYVSPSFLAALVALFAVLGAVMGSFLNCAAYRLVHHEPVARGRSHCAVCGHTLGPLDLVPVFSWLFLKGRCRYCGEKVSPRYLAAELLLALLYVSVLLRFGLSWETARFLLLLSVVFAGALVDLSDGWIPDRFLLIGAAGYFPLAWLSGGGELILQGLIGAVCLFLPLLAVVLVMDKVMKTETMGGGDLKLFALLGLYFGWKQGLLLILLACVVGLVMIALMGRLKKKTQTPFGPALFLSAWAVALVGEAVIHWYTGLFF